jgi:5-methylcytosine-specific restriction endonuclease McrA
MRNDSMADANHTAKYLQILAESCPKCGGTEFYVIPERSRICRACSIKRTKAWREANKDAIRARRSARHAANKDKINALTKAWKEAHKDWHRAYAARYRKENPERKRLSEHNRRARTKGKLSADIFEKLFKLQKGKCACCGKKLGKDFHLDHIVPLSKGGLNVDSNVQLLTAFCNVSKKDKDPIEFMQKKGFLL